MKNNRLLSFLFLIIFISPCVSQSRSDVVDAYTSIYQTKLEDSLAVYFTPDAFNIKADGSVDVSDALQKAINTVQETVRYGIVFIPEGIYRISKTIYLWKGIRLIGYGKKRPVFILPENTPEFQEGEGKYLIHFCSDRPRGNQLRIQDANAGTFYSGIRNIDITISKGNPKAIGVRFHAAQHCFLSHIDFRLSAGNTAVEDICNEIEYCRFYGGDYAIRTGKTAPGWQALLLDSYFEKQNQAAILTEEVGLTLIRNHFKDIPVAVSINKDRSEKLWISDSRFENIAKTAVIVSNENNPGTHINMDNVVCIKVPEFLSFRTNEKNIKAPSNIYQVSGFMHGLRYNEQGLEPAIVTEHQIIPLRKIPESVCSDVPMLPHTHSWINLKSLGAKGDGFHDDTEVIKQAIKQYSTIYLPSGHYRVTEPIIMQPYTHLVGLHPSITQILLRDSTLAFQGIGAPLPLLEAPRGGTNIVTGIGLNTSGINPRAVAAKWMAGSESMMNDVRFTGGHGTYELYGRDVRTYNDNRTSDGIPYRKWDTQYWSLWITEGGGGTFKDIWTPSPYASAGMYISNTSTSGRIYYMSSEHHVRNEIKLNNVSGWKIFGLQLEEESGEGPYCLPLEINNSHDILFANTFSYRVSRVTTPFPYAVLAANSTNIVFRGLRASTWTKYLFDNTLVDVTNNWNIREREIAYLKLTGKKAESKESKNEPVKKLAGSFDFIDGVTVDADGNIYFVDARWHRIYCWNVKEEQLKVVCDVPISPVSLAFDTKGNLIVVTRYQLRSTIFERGDIRVISLNPANPEETITELEEVPIESVNSMKLVIYQSSRYRMENNLFTGFSTPAKTCFVAKDGVTIIPNTPDIGQTYTLKSARPGETVYVSSSAAQKTLVGKINENGSVSQLQLFVEEGEQSNMIDKEENVYLAAGNIKKYNKNGNLIKEIYIPERPSSIVFGGKDKNSLFICAGSSLYCLEGQ